MIPVVVSSGTALKPPQNKLLPDVTLGTCCYSSCSYRAFDCWKNKTFYATKAWLELGGIAVDTAQAYRNQVDVGRAIIASHVDRKNVFVETKCR